MKKATKKSSTPGGLSPAYVPSASSRVLKKQGSSTKQPNLTQSASVVDPNEVRSSQAIGQRVLDVSKHESAILNKHSSPVTVPQTICHLTDPESQSTACETRIKSNAKKASSTTITSRTSASRGTFSTKASKNGNIRHSPKEWYAPSKASDSVVQKCASSEPLLDAARSHHRRRTRKASSAGSIRDERPAAATSAASVSAEDRTWKLASEARTFIRSREEPSPVNPRPSRTADHITSQRSESFSLDTALIVELQNMTNEAAIRDMIRRIEQSMTLAVSLAEDQPSTSTTTITLPVEPPTSTSTFEESPSRPARSSTVDTRTPSTSEDTSRFTSSKKAFCCPLEVLASEVAEVDGEVNAAAVEKNLLIIGTAKQQLSHNSFAASGSATRESTSATTSSKGESSNATGETESGWHPLCLQFKVLAVVAVALLLYAVVVLIPRLNRTRGSLARSSQEQRDWSSVCNNPACHRALDSLTEAMDLNVSPCDDFYRHVCGRWRARNPKRLSYASENHHNFLMGIHRRLAGHSFDSRWNGSHTPPNHGGCERRNRIVAAFYASCLNFGRRPSIPSLHAVLSRVGIDTTVWLSSKNLQELLARVVSACLNSGLASAISVRKSRDGHSIFIEVGETLKHSLDNGDDDIGDGVSTGRPRWFVENAIEELQLDIRWAVVAELDGFVDRIRTKLEEGHRSEPFRNIANEQLPRKLAELPWHSVLVPYRENETSYYSSDVPKNLLFYVRGLVEVGEVLRALGDWREPDVVNLYTLLVPAAQLFAYVRPWLVPRNDREDTVIPACLRATEHRFVSVFPSLLEAWTETTRARLYFRDMVSTLRRALGNPIPDKNDLARNEVDAYVLFRVVTIAERNESESACHTEDLSSIFLSTEDFIGNLILLFKEDRFTSTKQYHAHIAKAVTDGLYQLHSCLGSSVSGVGHTVFVPPLYLSGELLQAEASVPSLDVPTVGVPILISWARSMMSTGEDDWFTTAASYGSCVRKNHPLDHALSDRASDEALLTNALLVPWATRVALTAAATMTAKEYGAFSYGQSTPSASAAASTDSNDSARTQVFFGRLCLVECGDPTGAPACIYATAHSPDFAEAFGCPRRPEPPGHHPCTDILRSLAARLTSISGNSTLT